MFKLSTAKEKQVKVIMAGMTNQELQKEIADLEYTKQVSLAQGLDTSDMDYYIQLRKDSITVGDTIIWHEVKDHGRSLVTTNALLLHSSDFRRKIGSDLEATANRVTQVLSNGGIASTIVGGYALQEHHYHRNTLDIDLLVPSINMAWDQLSIRGFKPTGSKAILYDRSNGVEINLLEAHGQATSTSPLRLPGVTHAPTSLPFIMPLSELIEMKLNVYVGNPLKYAKHGADIAELIQIHDLSFEAFHSLNAKIQNSWEQFWSAVQD